MTLSFADELRKIADAEGGGREATQDDVVDLMERFAKNEPDDKIVHAFADERGINKHSLEDKIYGMLDTFWNGGLSRSEEKGNSNPASTAEGAKIEKEHVKSGEWSKVIASKIAKDHLTEDPNYYDKLKKMEKAASELPWQRGPLSSKEEARRNEGIGPPPSPNRDPYPFVGTLNFQGIKINVENKTGDIRKGKDPKHPWKTYMRFPYGEIEGSKGVDKDLLDVYVGPHRDSQQAFIVHQNHPLNHPDKKLRGTYDEDKVMLGFTDADEARDAYYSQYDDPSFFRSITQMDIWAFRTYMTGENKGEKLASDIVCAGFMDEFQKIANDPLKQLTGGVLGGIAAGSVGKWLATRGAISHNPGVALLGAAVIAGAGIGVGQSVGSSDSSFASAIPAGIKGGAVGGIGMLGLLAYLARKRGMSFAELLGALR